MLTLLLCPSDTSDRRRLLLIFHDVRELSFGPGVFFPFLSLLEIRSIQDQQWEDLKYRVVNAEQDNDLRFYCHHFDATIVEPTSNPADCGR